MKSKINQQTQSNTPQYQHNIKANTQIHTYEHSHKDTNMNNKTQ